MRRRRRLLKKLRLLKDALGRRPHGIEMWFQDEARVGQKGSLSYVWAPVGSRPPMVATTAMTRSICLARSVRARLGAAIIMPAVNTEA